MRFENEYQSFKELYCQIYKSKKQFLLIVLVPHIV